MGTTPCTARREKRASWWDWRMKKKKKEGFQILKEEKEGRVSKNMEIRMKERVSEIKRRRIGRK